jgi:hypothetical protein
LAELRSSIGLLLDLVTANDIAVNVNGTAALASDTAVIGTRDQKGQTGNKGRHRPLPSSASVILSSS